MRNKRTLKREIKCLCSTILAECEAMRLYGKAKDTDLQALYVSTLRIYSNAICRISHPEPGVKPSAYYKDLKQSLARQVEELVEQINALA